MLNGTTYSEGPAPDTTAYGQRAAASRRLAVARVAPRRRSGYELRKRLFDIAFASFFLVLTAPIWVLVAVLVKLTSKGPALFRQPRCGHNGRVFTCYKFRTMVDGADELKADLAHLNEVDGPVFKIRNDPRVTTLGRWLRRTSIDEIPNLFNVLMGDMSIVGPRPPLPSEVARYRPKDMKRLAVKPGITCLWQVSGRNNINFDRWIELDVEYIQRRSFWFDVGIVLRTIPAVLRGTGAS